MIPDLRRIIWLASYPKSGNTWVRTFLANYFLGRRKSLGINELRKFTLSDVRIDFYQRAMNGKFHAETLDDYAGVRARALRLIAAEREGTHFVKTHTRIDTIGNRPLIPPELTAAAVYILRNPFDVAPSFARHSSITLDESIDAMTDREMVSTSPAGVFEVLGRWDEHIASWLDAPGLPRHVLRYEDLHANPRKAYTALLEFLRTPVNTAHLKRTIEGTRFENLKKQEEKDGFVERPQQMKAFFHSGKAGGWRDVLSDQQVARLHTAFEPALRKWYPELVDETAAIAAKVGG